jgi:hypothetical protein
MVIPVAPITETQPKSSLYEEANGILCLDTFKNGMGMRQPYSLLKEEMELSYADYVRLVDQGLLNGLRK